MFNDSVNSEEIAPFRLTGYDGEVYIRMFNDIYREKNNEEETSRREGKTLEEGFDVTLHSYFYHPNFFRLDFGGGPVYIRHIYDSDSVHTSGGEEEFNYHARAHFLEKKPFPLTLYYDRHYNTTPYAVQDRVILKSESYGLNFKLKKPLVPLLAVFDISRSNIDGETARENLFRYITDETTDRASVKVSGDLGPNGDGAASFTKTRIKSGNLTSFTQTENDTETTKRVKNIKQFDGKTNHLFGTDQWVRFSNTLRYRDQDNLPDLEEFRYTPKVNLTHSKNLKSYYRYSYVDRTVEEIDTTAHEFDTGMSLLSLSGSLDTNLDFHADRYETEGLDQEFYQADGKLSYLQTLTQSQIRYTGAWGVDYTDRETDQSTVPVRAEVHTVENIFDTFELENENVVQSSVEIFNTQGDLCIEGTHYQLIRIADVTEVEWQADLDDPTCPLLPDNQVLVNYSYETGGSATFTGLRQFYGIDYTKGNILRLYGRYRSIDRDLESGDPTIPINSERTYTLGVNSDYPLYTYLTVGGKAEYEDHDADIGSYRRSSLGGFLHIPRLLLGDLRLFADRLYVDNLETTEDVDLFRYGLRYHSRVWFRTRLTADYSNEKDTGGRRDRSTERAKLRLSWAYRKLSLSAEARYRVDELGVTESKRTSVNLILSRRF